MPLLPIITLPAFAIIIDAAMLLPCCHFLLLLRAYRNAVSVTAALRSRRLPVRYYYAAARHIADTDTMPCRCCRRRYAAPLALAHFDDADAAIFR